jgi:hypothetical protein
MAESVAELLGRLRFVGGPVETLYLNETRVHANFIGNLGEIASFAKRATRIGKGTVNVPVIEIGGEKGTEVEVTYTLNEPITQVLVLRDALESAGSLYGLDDAGAGRFVRFTGSGLISRPGIFDDLHRMELAEHPHVYDVLEARRAAIEGTSALTSKTGGSRQWLLTVSAGTSVCAAVLDDQWLRADFFDWFPPGSPGNRHELFGLFRQHESGIPILATAHLGVKL